MKRQMFLVSAAVLLAATSAANACGTGQVLFSDTFDAASDAWSGTDGPIVVNNGNLVLTVDSGHYTQASTTKTFNDVDFCADLKLTDSKNPPATYGGLTFWAVGPDQFYTFQITLDGYATVYQYAHDDWSSVIDDRQVGSIKQGIGAMNELRVVTQGGTATLYINDVKFDTVNGTAPSGGQSLGFTIQAPDEGAATFLVDKVEVRAAEGSTPPTSGSGGETGNSSAINGGGPTIKP